MQKGDHAMNRIIKTIPATEGELYIISAGKRHLLANFNGCIAVREVTELIPILGTVQKGTKTIQASFIVCGDLEYQREISNGLINSGKVYEAIADVEGEKIFFAGLRFENSDPIKNELIFEITDLELIEKFMR